MSSRFRCLILEDDSAFATLLCQVVEAEGGDPIHCATIREAIMACERGRFDLMLLDNHLPDGRSYDFFNRITRQQADPLVIMVTGLPNLSEAISLTRNGLFDYLAKPVTIDALTACLRRALQRLRTSPDMAVPNGSFFGGSAAMQSVLRDLRDAAQHPTATVLLTGESGVGKDVAARALHEMTHGKDSSTLPYVPVNCAALPSEMFEAELFGAERGAYTGADRKRDGLALSARGGTLFLDEIGEVPMPMQSKLLRFLESREYRSLGGSKLQIFEGRFVAATNKSLQDEVSAGRFREDLWYRMQVVVVEIPPLRQRRDELPALTHLLVSQLAARYSRIAPRVREEDLAGLAGYEFPGNIRELRNILERGLLRTPRESRWLMLDPIWFSARTPVPGHTRSIERAAPEVQTPSNTAPTPVVASISPSDASLPPARELLSPLEAQEYRLLRKALAECQGGIRKAASMVGLSPQALLRRLEKWPELRDSHNASPSGTSSHA